MFASTLFYSIILPVLLHGFSSQNMFRRITGKISQNRRFLSSYENGPAPEFVYILLFNADSDEEGGIHTLEFPQGSGNNIILAFAEPSECQHFARSLKEKNFYEPKPQKVPLESLIKYVSCMGENVRVEIVPKGYNLSPPSNNVDTLSFNPNRKEENRFLDYLYQVSRQASPDGLIKDNALNSWE